MAKKKTREAGLVVLVLSFAILVVSMGLEGPTALALNAVAIVGFVVALAMQLLPGSDEPEK